MPPRTIIAQRHSSSIRGIENEKVQGNVISSCLEVPNKIYTENNIFKQADTQINFRGVSTAGFWVGINCLTDIEEAYLMGINCVRLAVHPIHWTADPTSMLEDNIIPIVHRCGELGIYIIIDWHAITDWTDSTMQTNTTNFWTTVAPCFANYPYVVYEAFNEPYIPGQPETEATYQGWLTYAQTLYDTIRELAPDTIILMGSPVWSSITRYATTNPLTATNIGYVIHIYQNSHAAEKTSNGWTWDQTYDYSFGDLAEQYPVVITEWGYSTNPARSSQHYYDATGSFKSRFRAYCDNNPHINWIAFAYANSIPGVVLTDTLSNFREFTQKWFDDINGLSSSYTDISSINPNAVFELDATESVSYNGVSTSKTLYNIVQSPADGSHKSLYDFNVGGDNTTNGTDNPSFIGSVGDNSSYFETDGTQFFKLPANTNFLDGLLKSTGGSPHSIVLVGNFPSTTSTSRGFCGTGGGSTSLHGIGYYNPGFSYVNKIGMGRYNGAGVNNIYNTSTTSDGTDKLIVMCYDPTTYSYKFYINSSTPSLSGTASALTETANASYPFEIFAVGGGLTKMGSSGKLYAFAVISGIVSDSDVSSIISYYENKHGRTYH